MKNNKNNKNNVKKTKSNGQNQNNTILALTKGSVLAYLITAIVFIVYGILLTYTDVTEKNTQIIVMVTTAISVLIGGFVASKGVENKGLFYGMLVGVVYAIIMIMIGLCFMQNIGITSKMITILILSICSGGIGGIIGINTKNN